MSGEEKLPRGLAERLAEIEDEMAAKVAAQLAEPTAAPQAEAGQAAQSPAPEAQPEAAGAAAAAPPEAAPAPAPPEAAPRAEAPPPEAAPRPEAARPTDVAVAEVREALAEQVELKKENLTPQERELLEAIVHNKSFWSKLAGSAEKKVKKRRFGGMALDFVASFGSTTALRLGARQFLESAFSLTHGVVAGGIIGAAFGGVRKWREAHREQYAAANWTKELEQLAGKDGTELAVAHEAFTQAIKEAKVRGNEDEALDLIKKLRFIEAKIKVGTPPPADPGEAAEKGVTGLDQAMPTTDLEGRKKEMFLRMIKFRKEAVRKKVFWGAVKGGAVGMVGGAVAELLVDQIQEWLESGKGAVAPEATAAALAEKAQAAQQEAMRPILEKAISEMGDKEFVMYAQKGEGLTHIARNLIHDYIVQLKELGAAPAYDNLERAQLVYAEDWLRRRLEHPDELVQLGEKFEIKGERIEEALKRALGLTDSQIQNLQENWVPKISGQTWGKMTDYTTDNYAPFEKANDFAQAAVAQAMEAKQKAMEQVVQQTVQEGPKAAEEGVPRTEKDNRTLYYILGGIAASGAVGVAGYALYRRYGRKPGQRPLGAREAVATGGGGGGAGGGGEPRREEPKTDQPPKPKKKEERPATRAKEEEGPGPKPPPKDKPDVIPSGVFGAEEEEAVRREIRGNILALRNEHGVFIDSDAQSELPQLLEATEHLREALRNIVVSPGTTLERNKIYLQGSSEPTPLEGDVIYLRLDMKPSEMNKAIVDFLANRKAQQNAT